MNIALPKARIIARLILPALAFVAALPGYAGFESCQEYVTLGVPGPSGDQLCRIGYAVAHGPERKTPIWVAERLTRERAMAQAKRKDLFAPDPDLSAGQRAELRDYKGSKLDRGHMAPNADFNWDTEAAKQSFYLSNMVPQVSKGMNRGIWKELESGGRSTKVRFGRLVRQSGSADVALQDCL